MKAKILLIEGKRADRPLFVAGLTRKGYQVESVANGSEAMARLEPFAPDLIIINAASMRTSRAFKVVKILFNKSCVCGRATSIS